MSLYAIDLCRDIIDQDFGPIIQAVATKLIAKGRSTLGKLSKELQLPQKLIRESLAILIQHNVVTFTQVIERGRNNVYYQVSIENILERKRFASYINLIEGEYDLQASLVVEKLLNYGRLQAVDLVSLLEISEDDVYNSIHTLLQSNYIVEVSAQDQNTLSDIYIQQEKDAVEKAGILTSTEMKKLRAKLAADRIHGEEMKAGKKRMLMMDDEPNKMIKLDDNTCYKVNYKQFHIHFRNLYLISFTEAVYNTTAGQILKAFFNLVGNRTRNNNESTESISVMTLSIEVAKNPEVNLDTIQGPVTNALAEYMEIMSQEQDQIFKKSDESGGGQYLIPLKKVCENIRINIIENTIKERYGGVACRLWRLLREKKKLDDKNVSKFALVDEKDARKLLYQMLKDGFVFMQDVPKTIDHSASRTLFLWYADVKKTTEILIQNGIKTMHRLHNRQRYEISRKKLLLQKANRSDIKSGEAKLSDGELKILEELESLKSKLSIQSNRVDLIIMVLRDFQ